MFEKRPIWGLIVGLNVCVLIWITVQEPVIVDVNTAALTSSNNYLTSTATGSEGEGIPLAAASEQHVIHNGWRRDLLSKHKNVEYADNMSLGASNLTTLNFNNKHKNNNNNNSNSNNINNATATSKETTFSHTFDVKSTTKTSDLSVDIQSLTSSLGAVNRKAKPTPSSNNLTAVTSALPDEDFSQLIDLKDFQFVMSQPVCSNHIEALILIHSAPKNHEKRQVIRDTWASISQHTTESPLRVLFLLASVASEQMQTNLNTENNIHRDIIQGSFIDAYRNMTYKHIMGFKWFLYNCPQATILIKVDDDVYVNTPQLIKYIKEHHQQSHKHGMNMANNDNPTIATTVSAHKTTADTNTTTTTTINSTASSSTKFSSLFQKLNIFASVTPTTPAETSSFEFNASQQLFNHPQNLLFCKKTINSMVKRSYRSKWRVSFKDYSERYYPPYCPGYAIIYSPDVIIRLYTAAQNSKYFWIDDVHITGILAQQTNTTITTSSYHILNNDECDDILTGKTDFSKKEFLFAWKSISIQKMKQLWHLQMMAAQTLNDLHYTELTVNNADDTINSIQNRRHRHNQQQRRRNVL